MARLKQLRLMGMQVSSALLLQGCVAAVIPLAAAGVIGKKEIDKARLRAEQAQASFNEQGISRIVTVGEQPPAVPAPSKAAPGNRLSPLDPADPFSSSNVYLPFARYAIEQAEKQQSGETVRSAVLVEKIELHDPKTMACDGKPALALIDLDAAEQASFAMDSVPLPVFAETLKTMRTNGVRIAWIAEANEAQIGPVLESLRSGDAPAIHEADVTLFGKADGIRKQERRWQLAREHCVVAIAGDRRADFDELYDYLRDPGFAIRLEPMFGKGWFELAQPASATKDGSPQPHAQLDPHKETD